MLMLLRKGQQTSFGREEVQKAGAELVVLFLMAVLCGLGIIVKEMLGCLIAVACELSLQCEGSCLLTVALKTPQSSAPALGNMLHCLLSHTDS